MQRNLSSPVRVTPGSVPAQTQRDPERLVCVLGICPPGSPYLTEQIPGATLYRTEPRGAEAEVEHLRVDSLERFDLLPGLQARFPSRLRDSLRLLRAAGARQVDLVLARGPNLRPWDLDRPEAVALLSQMLDGLPGATVLLPDIGGPAPVGPTGEDPAIRVARLRATVAAFRTLWRERYHIALADALPGVPVSQQLKGVAGSDLALCSWSGSERALATHGWRSAAALVAGALVIDEPVSHGLIGRKLTLPDGRVVVPDRRRRLGGGGALAAPDPLGHHLLTLDLHPRKNEATIIDEPVLRAPLGEWQLSALRAVKVLHRRIVETAERYVFRPINQPEAYGLVAAIELAIRPFSQAGMLTGAGGVGAPSMTAEPVRHAEHPGFVATLSAQLRPWHNDFHVRLTVRPGSPPQVQVRT